MKAKWLYSKHPIVIDTDLAVALGSNGDREAIVLQQLNYWLHSKWAKEINGRMWIYNTFENWQKDNFPWLSLPTVKRIFTKLEKKGLIITGNFNKAGFDKTKWYSIDEDKLNELMSHASYQNDTTIVSKRDDGEYQNDTTYTRDYTETTTDKDIDSTAKAEPPIYKEVIDYLNAKAGTKYKPSSAVNKRLIDARIKDGYFLDDFKTVIQNKCATWLHDSKMSKYLRPQTLFGTKFEGYLNEKMPGISEEHSMDPRMLAQVSDVDEDDLPF